MPKPSGEQKTRERLWQSCLGVYCIALLIIMLGFLFVEYYFEEPAIELSAYAALKDPSEMPLVRINSATRAELETLPRVGPVLAQRIIDYRTEHGAFVSAEGLLEVPGIGEATLKLLRPLILLD